jgi:hypothetical protein
MTDPVAFTPRVRDEREYQDLVDRCDRLAAQVADARDTLESVAWRLKNGVSVDVDELASLLRMLRD